MDCHLKIIAGPEAGQDFRCSAAQTLLGRAPRCAIRLSAPSISFEHALISRTGDEFFIENLSANGTFLNDERLTAKTKLHLKDRIRLGAGGGAGTAQTDGQIIARIESLPAASGATPSRRGLLIALALLLLGAVVIVIWDPLSATSNSPDLTTTYLTLDQYVKDEVTAQRLDPQALTLLEDAWRLQQSNDHPAASTRWIKLRVLLSAPPPVPPSSPPTSSPTPSTERTALLHFISQMERQP